MMLDEFSGLIHERWAGLAFNEVDSLPTMIGIDSPDPGGT